MLALLHDAAERPPARRARRSSAGTARRLLERSDDASRAAAEPQQSLVDPLSQRELEVLRLLDSELTGPQIARELYVSLNTLRTHTKRIFTKLDVNDPRGRRAHAPTSTGSSEPLRLPTGLGVTTVSHIMW